MIVLRDCAPGPEKLIRLLRRIRRFSEQARRLFARIAACQAREMHQCSLASQAIAHSFQLFLHICPGDAAFLGTMPGTGSRSSGSLAPAMLPPVARRSMRPRLQTQARWVQGRQRLITSSIGSHPALIDVARLLKEINLCFPCIPDQMRGFCSNCSGATPITSYNFLSPQTTGMQRQNELSGEAGHRHRVRAR